MDARRQHPDRRRLVGVLSRDLRHPRSHRLHQVLGAVHAVKPGHPDHQVVLFQRHRPAGTVRRDLPGDAVDLGFVDVAQPELDLGAQVVADPRLQFRPAWCGNDDVNAERQPLRGQVLDLPFKIGKLTDEGRPAVDDQEYVAVWIGRDGLARVVAQLSIHRDRAHPVFLEGGLALPHHRLHLRDHPVDLVRLGPARDPADVRQVLQIDQTAAAEVDAVELDIAR